MSNGTPSPNDPVQALLAQTSLQNTLFAATSRYYGIATDTLDLPGGRTIVYVKRRFVPPPEDFQVLQEHTVVQGDRLDIIAGKYLGEPTLFWRLADANRAMRPDELTEAPGRVLKITLPLGITGSAL
jgi:nucleoid-associated protein YgaU